MEGDCVLKVFKFTGLLVASLFLLAVIIVFEIRAYPVGSSIAGIILGFCIPALYHSIQDLTDTTNWKASQRKLMRAGYIKKDDIIRISFAYLYRIKVDDKYFLVLNDRNTGKYQPVGGVYKFTELEKMELRKHFHVIDDDKIPIDESSRYDYRLQLKNNYLRKFMRRFDSKAIRERIDSTGREYKEELIDTGLLSWTSLKYRICGRHMTEIKYSEHFQTYELLLADVVEPILTVQQESDLRALMNVPNTKYRFVKADEIKSLGVNTGTSELKETIADHTKKILQETEDELLPIPRIKKETYTVTF